MSFELQPYNPKLKHSDKAPIIVKSIVKDDWSPAKLKGYVNIRFGFFFDEYPTEDCQQLVLKTQCKACGEWRNPGEHVIHKNECFKPESPDCDGKGHTYLIVHDKPCEDCEGRGELHGFYISPDVYECSTCQGFGGVSVERILKATDEIKKCEVGNPDHHNKYNQATSYLTYCEGILTR